MKSRDVRACIWGLALIALAALLFFLGDLSGAVANCLGEPFC